MTKTPKTETVPYFKTTITQLAEAGSTPEETYTAAEVLAKTVFPRETGTDAVMRLHGMSHAEALKVAERVSPYTPAFATERERIDFEHGMERAQGLEEE